MSEANVEEARRILLEAGAIAEQIDIREWKAGEYLVSAVGFGCGVTDRREQFADTPQEVATNLVAAKAEAAYGGGHDSDAISETDGHSGVGEAAPQDQFAESDGGAQGGSGGGGDGGDSDFLVGTSEPDDLGAADDSFDLGSIEDYTPDPALLEGADATDAEFSEPEEEPDEAASQFIFGDGLYQMRVAAIGLVTVKAASLMPDVDLVRLSELRNFAMGVSEKRWDDDAAKREELDTLEATARLANAIAKARDDKAAYLLDATREQVEAFDVEANWP